MYFLSVSSSDINTVLPGAVVIITIANFFNATTIHICKKGVGEGIAEEVIDNSTARYKDVFDIRNIFLNECCRTTV